MVDRAPSTISRELRRNQTGRCYQPDATHRLACTRRTLASRRMRIPAAHIQQIEAFWPRISDFYFDDPYAA